jgi:hypothetical protein
MFKSGNPPTPAGQSLKVVMLQALRVGKATGKGLEYAPFKHKRK